MSRFEMNADVIESLAHTDEMQDAMTEIAEQLADVIRDLTPEMSTPQTAYSNSAEPGAMRESIEVIDSPDNVGGARVAAMDHRFHWIEFGTGMRENHEGAARGEMPAFAPFRRGAESTSLGRYDPTTVGEPAR